MRKINILVLGVSSNVSQSIITAIRESNIDCNLVGACVIDNSVGKYLVDNFYLCPFANNKNFIPWLINCCQENHIDIVLSGVEENLEIISSNFSYLQNQVHSHFIVPMKWQLEIANDKFLTCEWLKKNNCNYPKYTLASNADEVERLCNSVNFPLIAKPRKGKGSNGIYYINSKDDFMLINNKDDYVIEEFLGTDEDEYTVGIYNNREGVFQEMIIMKRLLKNGTTIYAESMQNKIIYDECKKISEKLKIKGSFNIQLRIHNEKAICFEINNRFSGSTSMRSLLGFKDVVACIMEYCYNEQNLLPYLTPKLGKVIRFYTEKLVG